MHDGSKGLEIKFYSKQLVNFQKEGGFELITLVGSRSSYVDSDYLNRLDNAF